MTGERSIDTLLQSLQSSVQHRIWLLSDLQQSELAHARECLQLAVADFASWRRSCDAVWYLGDAVEGPDLDLVTAMAVMQKEVLSGLGTPVRYVMGNHDFDPWRDSPFGTGYSRLPFWQMTQEEQLWRSTERMEDWYFTETLGSYLVVFLSDHGSAAEGWFTTHGRVRGEKTLYPVFAEQYAALQNQIRQWPGSVITCSHYAFPGGNRPSPQLGQLLPLPENVRLHIYGHSHIGDTVWGGEHAYRKIAGVNDQPVVQLNISSLEDLRGNEVRSALLEIYTDGTLGVYFRDHRAKRWADAWLGTPKRT